MVLILLMISIFCTAYAIGTFFEGGESIIRQSHLNQPDSATHYV